MGAITEKEGLAAQERLAKDDIHVDMVQIDVTNSENIFWAVQKVKQLLKGESLYALVNNAGILKNPKDFYSEEEINPVVDVNFWGVVRCTQAFLPLLKEENARVVNTGSGSGCFFVQNCYTKSDKVALTSDTTTWSELEEISYRDPIDISSVAKTTGSYYGFSKSLVAQYTKIQAKENPDIGFYVISPGFIDSAITQNTGKDWYQAANKKKPPSEGTVSLRHCLLEADNQTQSGWFFGPDAKRSPQHFVRNPGEPVYTGDYNAEAEEFAQPFLE